ncbi:MAG: hypothetical protein QM401_07295 [Bacillota bacterium]|nr:hypothetical protein [Bacillota bacterium]
MKYMIPNHKRPNIKQQKFIVHAINRLGYEPFRKPIHLYSWDEFQQISMMYREVAG